MSPLDYGDPEVREGIWEKLWPEPNTGCWLWSGEEICRYGRAQVHIGSRHRKMVHVITFEASGGVIPDGHEMDHLCVMPLCANPAHLEAVTHAENMRRRRKPFCKRGHVRDPNHMHDCRECAKLRARAQRERNWNQKMDPAQWDAWLTDNFVSA